VRVTRPAACEIEESAPGGAYGTGMRITRRSFATSRTPRLAGTTTTTTDAMALADGNAPAAPLTYECRTSPVRRASTADALRYARGEADRRKRTFGSFLGVETGVGRLGRRPARTAGLSGDEASGSWPRRL